MDVSSEAITVEIDEPGIAQAGEALQERDAEYWADFIRAKGVWLTAYRIELTF